MAFTFVRNLAGFEVTPVKYVLTPGESFTAGDVVKLSGGKVTKAGVNDVDILGVMAETITAASTGVTHGSVYDNPLNVYKAPYTGTGTPVVGNKYSLYDAGTIDADNTLGGLIATVLNVDNVNKTVDIVITKHLLN